MKNFVSLFVILLVCISCWIPVASAQDIIPDPILRSRIQQTMSIGFADVTTVNILNLTQLTVGAPNIFMPSNPAKNLGGLEHATNLERLTVWYHDVSDLTPVGNLANLTSLTVIGNTISDLTPLKNLPELRTLALTANNIQAIPPLENLPNLKTLTLGGNNLGDNIKGLSTLTTLTELRLDDTGVQDIAPLRGLTNLEKLYLLDNQIIDISPLEGMTKLKELSLQNNQIRDISPLQRATELGIVYLEGNQIRDLSSLEEWNEQTRFVAGFAFFGGRLRFSRSHLGNYDTNPLSYPSIYTYLPALIDRYSQLFSGNVSYEFRVPTTLEVISGDGATVVSGEALPEPLIVKVQDEHEERFAGVPVTFAVTEGDGTVEPAETTALDPTYNLRDEEEGEAQTTFTAGESIGQQTVVATVTHEDTTLQVTFTINVQPGAIAAPTIATVDPPLPTTLPVRWAAPSYAVQSYEIRYRVADSEAWTVEVLEGTETLFTLPDLIPGTTYEWQVRAETEVGFAPWSPSGFATTGISAPTIATVDPPYPPRCP